MGQYLMSHRTLLVLIKVGEQKGVWLENGPPSAIRTRDLRLRRATLYPAELRVEQRFH